MLGRIDFSRLKLLSRRYRWRFQRSLIIGVVIALVLLILWRGDFFVGVRLRMNDTYIVPATSGDTISLIAIDDASFAAYGRSLTDWGRTRFTDLVTLLDEAGARVVTFDVLMSEPSPDDQRFAETVTAARESETRLRTILTAVGAQVDGDYQDGAVHFQQAVSPPPVVRNAVENIGFINVFPDADNTIRRQMSRVFVDTQEGYSLAIATYLAYLRIPPSAAAQLVLPSEGSLTVTPNHVLQVDSSGMWRPNSYQQSADVTFPTYSLKEVLDGTVDPALFRDRIVFVGLLNAAASTDLYTVPTAPNHRLMAGVELHAQAVETLLQNAPLIEQSALSQAVAIILLSLTASMVYGMLRWTLMLPAALLFIGLWLILAFVTFSTQRILIDLFYSLLALAVPLGALLLVNFALETRQRKASEFLLRSVVDVSQQQMSLNRIMAQVAGDIQGLVKTNTGAVWLQEPDSAVLSPACEWNSVTEVSEWATARQRCGDLAVQVSEARRTIIDRDRVGVPVLWQGRLLAVFTMVAKPGTRVVRRNLEMLETLAAQIAPSIENALLFDQTIRQKTLLEALLTESPAGLMVLDGDLRLTRSNAAVDVSLGVHTEDWYGQPIGALLAGAKLEPDHCIRLEAQITTWKPFREQLKHRQRTLIVDAAPLNAIREWILVLNDVTPLAELSEVKTQMIRMASHDLNNPLTNVIVTTQILLDDHFGMDLPNKVRPSVERIQRASHHMRQIIEDILNLERIRSQSVLKSYFDFSSIVRDVCDRLLSDAERKAQRLTVEIEPDLPQLYGDQVQIQQVIQNLVGNAIKYTPEDGCVYVRLIYDIDRLLLEVEDTGYGIPEIDQNRIFQEFFRAKSGATASIPGTGLGLSLVKSVVTAHGGRVWFHSAEGEGTTFFLELPVTEKA
ncbi:MAG: CHASE2 domain-containing protein [Anaerolineae bacterium]